LTLFSPIAVSVTVNSVFSSTAAAAPPAAGMARLLDAYAKKLGGGAPEAATEEAKPAEPAAPTT